MKITLSNLFEATAQQVFDQVAAHLINQGEKSVKPTNGNSNECVYRQGTLKCAAGCLIADDEYLPEMDEQCDKTSIGTSWNSLVKRNLVPQHSTEAFITVLQELHDNHSPSNYRKELLRVADENNLSADVLHQITLANLEYATAQQVFDQVAVHLLIQKRPATRNDGSTLCVYRSPDGLKCAAGCLIADHEYLPKMDDLGESGWYSLINRGLVPEAHKALIGQLQGVHDNSNSPDETRCRLKDLAQKYKLNTDAMDAVV